MILRPSRNEHFGCRENENILVIRFKSIGDVLFTLPAVGVIRDNFPGAKITFLTSRENAPLIQGFCDVDEVVGIDRSAYRRGNPRAIFTETFALLRLLRQKKFSLVVDFQGYGETGLIAWLSGAKKRWGSVYRPARSWAYTHPIQREEGTHPANWNLSLMRRCGLSGSPVRNEFKVPGAALSEARRFFTSQQMDPDKHALFLQPFTSTPKKNWPLENFLSLANHWKRRGVQVLFGGGPADRAKLEPASAAGFPVSAGAPLLVSAGLMKLCTLVVGGDTGLLHLAVAMNKRVVMLMHSKGHCKCHPYQHADWLLAPAPDNIIARITPGMAIETCSRALHEVRLKTALLGAISTHFLTGTREAISPSTEALPAP